jgi:hypothetical protein
VPNGQVNGCVQRFWHPQARAAVGSEDSGVLVPAVVLKSIGSVVDRLVVSTTIHGAPVSAAASSARGMSVSVACVAARWMAA